MKRKLIGLLSGPHGLEAAIAFLCQEGADKGESIESLIQAGVPYKEAKLAVHNSPSWKDLKQRDERLHEIITDIEVDKEQLPPASGNAEGIQAP